MSALPGNVLEPLEFLTPGSKFWLAGSKPKKSGKNAAIRHLLLLPSDRIWGKGTIPGDGGQEKRERERERRAKVFSYICILYSNVVLKSSSSASQKKMLI